MEKKLFAMEPWLSWAAKLFISLKHSLFLLIFSRSPNRYDITYQFKNCHFHKNSMVYLLGIRYRDAGVSLNLNSEPYTLAKDKAAYSQEYI